MNKIPGFFRRYLETWSEDRGNWKFEKCRQIWLLQNAYDKSKINDDKFDVLLNYMGSIQGKMRQMALGMKDMSCGKEHRTIVFLSLSESAKEKVDFEEKWKRILEEDGKTDNDAIAELGKPRLDPVIASRAQEIVTMLE